MIGLLFIGIGSVLAESAILQIPGRLNATGTHFELKNSGYIDIILDSSEPIRLVIESRSEIVTMYIENATGASSASITLSGFAPITIYHKYEDNYHNPVTFTTDSSGKYTYIQDISEPHLVFIQSEPNRISSGAKSVITRTVAISSASSIPDFIFLNDNSTGGDCTLIGTWDASTKTCSMTTDATATIEIDSSSITLDGNGHKIIGRGTNSGIFMGQNRDTGEGSRGTKEGVTIRNLNIEGFGDGIFFATYSNNNLIENNNISNNSEGVLNYYGASMNKYINNKIINNGHGVLISYSSGNNFSNNNISNNGGGIHWMDGPNTLIGNIISSNGGYGVFVDYITAYRSGGIIEDNIIINNRIGISLGDFWEGGVIVSSNFISNNSQGIVISGGHHKTFNNFFNNTDNVVKGNPYWGSIWNTTLTKEENIVGGPYLGGNFWAQPDGDGYSQKCTPDSHWICTLPYIIDENDIDYLPLASIPALIAEAGAYSGIVGIPISFTGSASGGFPPYSFSWDFGDGTVNTQQNPTHSYSSAGTYNTILTVTDGRGINAQDTSSVIVSIPKIPATVDIKPDILYKESQSDENTVTAYIEIPGYNVNAIDLSTVILSTNKGKVPAHIFPTEVGDYDSNGIPDRIVKFYRQAVIGIVDNGNVVVMISGKIEGEEFEGSDEIIVIDQPEQIPEFPTVVLPIISISGLIFLFQRRKCK